MSNQIQSKEIEYCQYQVQYFSDIDSVNDRINEAVFELNKELKKRPLFGFRPGKAPLSIIKSKFKKQINDFVAPKMLSKAFEEVLAETKIDPIGSPQVTRSELIDGKYFCEMFVTAKPKFELGEYKNFEISSEEIKNPISSINDLYEKQLNRLREKHSDLLPFEDSDELRMGDQATLDLRIVEKDADEFEITQDVLLFGQTDKVKVQEGILYTVGEKEMYPGFDNQIIGMKIDDSRIFDLKIKRKSKDNKVVLDMETTNKNHDPIRGLSDEVELSFHVKMTMGLKKTPCKDDQELVEKESCSSFDELKEKILKACENEIKRIDKLLLQQIVSNKILENHQFKIPDWMISGEAEQLAKSVQMEKPTDQMILQAEKNVRLSLILEEIRKKEPEAAISDLELISKLKNDIKDDLQLQKLIIEMEKSGQMGMWLAQSRVNYAMEWLLSTCKVV